MAKKAKKSAAARCAGRKANGQLKKNWKNKKGQSCPVRAKGNRR